MDIFTFGYLNSFGYFYLWYILPLIYLPLDIFTFGYLIIFGYLIHLDIFTFDIFTFEYLYLWISLPLDIFTFGYLYFGISLPLAHLPLDNRIEWREAGERVWRRRQTVSSVVLSNIFSTTEMGSSKYIAFKSGNSKF